MKNKSLYKKHIVPTFSPEFIKSQEKYKEFITPKQVNKKKIGLYPKAQY